MSYTPSLHGALMVQGTASSAGKSLLVAGLCRLLARQGVRVAPFKPQNMSNNAMVCVDGGEIGRAQALQARAARLPTSHHYNPILLKPLGDNQSQLVVGGRARGKVTAKQYYQMKEELLVTVLASYRKLQADHDVVLIEGAGSPAEVNLRDADIANMGFAERVNAPVLLVGDIDRGGVIAALVGTHAVLSPSDRVRIKGFVINKFRGDASLFDSALDFITQKTGWAAAGLVPFFLPAHFFPPEDSLSFHHQHETTTTDDEVVSAIITPSMANSDDLDPLAALLADNGYRLQYVGAGDDIAAKARLVLLLGSKNTIGDLTFLRQTGLAEKILHRQHMGTPLLAICGGYQMLGQTIADPAGLESLGEGGQADGLAILPLTTTLAVEKTLQLTKAEEQMFHTKVEGYEIHAGQTTIIAGADSKNIRPFLRLSNGAGEGVITADGKVMGTYLHGLLHNHDFLVRLMESIGLNILRAEPYHQRLDSLLDDWATWLEQHLDMKHIMAMIK